MKNKDICEKLDIMVPDAKCELIYNHDYELLIAVMLSAQCTDKRVNMVTSSFFKNRTLKDISKMDIKDIEKEIYSLGSYTKKAKYIKEIAIRLLNDYDGFVPNNREYLENLPGIGHKSCNVFLAEIYNEPTIAVDTHVERVSKRLEIVDKNDNIKEIEHKLEKKFAKKDYNRINHQLVLFGRYICKAVKPECDKCLFNCKYKKVLSIKNIS